VRRRLFVVLSVLSLAFPATALAQDPPPERFEPSPISGSVSTNFVPGALDPDRQVTVMVEMRGDPVAVAQAKAGRELSRDEKERIKNELKGRQDAIAPEIQARGGAVLSQVQVAYNGVKVRIARNQAAVLRGLPNVVAVRQVQPITLDNAQSVPGIGAPQVWQSRGLTGSGIKVAVIDTGIDYTHANFGGPGTTRAFEQADRRDTRAADARLFGPQAPKVKGGWDFVGDDYDASSDDPSRQVPRPDPNPLDCNGHGSHVAGTAAGLGVKADGTTYTGPYNASTHSTQFTIGPGVAPQAELYALRVFGCAGSTDVTVEAIDWAVDNGMDVINMSLGSVFGRADDPSAVASDNAALAGVVVVTSAGNSGPQQYITGSPGVATRAIATAAQDTIQSTPGVNLALTDATGASLGTILTQNSNDAGFTNGQRLAVHVLRNADGSVSLGCDPQQYIDQNVTGKLVVTLRGTCARVARAIFGQQAGAAAVAMINSDAGFPPFEGPITSNPDTGEQFAVTIPFLGVRGLLGPSATADGDTLVAAHNGTATMTTASIANPNFRNFASFSSGGPRRVDSALKPDITAPGVSIQSTLVGSGNGGTRISGTSMASPHVAGVAALTVQAHPTWSVEQIKAAVVNTADPAQIGSSGGNAYRISRGGTGLVQPAAATATSVVAVGSAPGTASLSFGSAELTANYSQAKTITLRNLGTAPATFVVGTAAPQGAPHSVALSTGSVTVPAAGTAAVNVTLNVPAGSVGSASAFREAAGLVTFSPQGGTNGGVALRVPYYLVPRGTSNVDAQLAATPRTGNSSVTVRNTGVAAGDADFYQWGLTDPNDALPQNDVRAVGAQTLPSELVGVPGDKLVTFAVNTWGRWDNNAVDEYDILLDVDEDGTDDYAVVGADIGLVTAGSFDGRMGAWVFDLASDTASVSFLASYRFTNGTTLLTVFASDIGLSSENPDFTYGAAAFSLRDGTGDDPVSGRARFNAWSPAVTGDYVTVAAGATARSNVRSDPNGVHAQSPLGLMVVSGDDRAGADEAQLIPMARR
jgi:minor extracellular serine protease Vpr